MRLVLVLVLLAAVAASAAPAEAAVRVPRQARAVDTSQRDEGGGGGAIFARGGRLKHRPRRQPREDRTGVLELRSSTLRRNPSDGFETKPGIFFLGRDLRIARSVVR